MVTLKTLVGVAGIGGMVTACTGLTLHKILQNRVRDSPVYQETMAMINEHPAADQLLGKPVKSNNVDVSNKFNIISQRFTNLEVPIYGSKNNAILYIRADRLSPEDSWNIYKVELEMLDNLGGKLSILDGTPSLEVI